MALVHLQGHEDGYNEGSFIEISPSRSEDTTLTPEEPDHVLSDPKEIPSLDEPGPINIY